MIDGMLRGGGYFWRGFPLIFRPRLRRYVWTPVALTIVIFVAAVWVTALYLTDLVDFSLSKIPAWLDWLDWLFWILFIGLWLMSIIFGFVLIANILAGPFNGLLSEAVESRLTGRPLPDDPWMKTFKRIPHIAWQETKKLLYYALWAIPFLILSCLTSVVGPILWILYSSWMLAVEFGDYPMDNNGHRFREVRRRLRKRWPVTLGFGGMTFLAFAIPGINLVAMPIAVCGATIYWIEDLSKIEDVAE